MDTDGSERSFLDRTRDFLRPLKDGVVRSYEVAALNKQVWSLRRELDAVTRDVGRQAIESLRQQGTLSADVVATLLRRVDDLEDRIAQKQRQIAEIEREDRQDAADPEPPPNS
jgi:hypothetical protein